MTKKLFITFFLILSLCVISCDEQSENITIEESNVKKELKIDLSVLSKENTVSTIEKNIKISSSNANDTYQKYTLTMYQPFNNFSDIYSDFKIKEKRFEVLEDYNTFHFRASYKSNMYFFAEKKTGEKYIYCYNIDNDTLQPIYTHKKDTSVSITAVNSRYLIWKEDENANWSKVSINCLDLNTGTNKKIFTYSRDPQNDRMYSWNFNDVVLNENKLYFDNTEYFSEGKPYITLYEYDLETDKISVIEEKRATLPMKFNTLSWISYDEEAKKYIIKDNQEDTENITIGKTLYGLDASNNIIVCKDDKSLVYFDGIDTHPIIKSTTHIDSINCSDDFIVWDGWNNDSPIFFDISKEALIYTDIIKDNLRWAGYVNDDYIIFEAHEFVPDTEKGEDLVTTKSLIYYFIDANSLKATTHDKS